MYGLIASFGIPFGVIYPQRRGFLTGCERIHALFKGIGGHNFIFAKNYISKDALSWRGILLR